MKELLLKSAILLAATASALSCTFDANIQDPSRDTRKKEVSFPVYVSRFQGQKGNFTKGEAVETGNKIVTMDTSIPLGLVGVDFETGALILDNEKISYSDGMYRGFFEHGLWDIPSIVSFSAYYPHVPSVAYGDEFKTYSIPFDSADTEAGPLISKTVQSAVDKLNMIPLEFQHITNDLGFKICDVTADPNLQGLIRLKKVTAHNIASAGVFVNDMEYGLGVWQRRGYYRDEVIFEGDEPVGVGMDNEMFIGRYALVPHMIDSYRFYAIPDDLVLGKQYVEVEFDIEDFYRGTFHYNALKNQKVKYMLYGVLPDNVMVYGKQYTFHLGLDTGKYYEPVSFGASVSDWETKIYENNDDF